VSDQILGLTEESSRCGATGPCRPLRDRLREGCVKRYGASLYAASGMHLAGCPWCMTEELRTASWPWAELEPGG